MGVKIPISIHNSLIFNVDKVVKSLKSASFVIPAKAGIQ